MENKLNLHENKTTTILSFGDEWSGLWRLWNLECLHPEQLSISDWWDMGLLAHSSGYSMSNIERKELQNVLDYLHSFAGANGKKGPSYAYW